jgi:Domain of unknown function (DUF4349)
MSATEAAELEAVEAALAGRDVPPEHAELAELALLLRDDRPAPDPRWASRLDQRVRAGFPKRATDPPRFKVWLRTLAPAIGVACVVLAITALALTAGGGSGEGDGGGAAGGASTTSEEAAEPASGDGAVAQERVAPRDPRSDARGPRSVERSATMTLATRARDIDRVAGEISRVAANLDGFVAASSISSTRGGSIDLRVPSARLDTAVQQLSRLADVRELTRQSQDITSSVVSARERLNDARTERESLLRQLANATTVNETESIRARLRIVSKEIAAARSRLRSVNNRAQFADIGVTLVAARGAGDDDNSGAWTPGDALGDAGRVLEVMAAVAVVALAVALPIALAIALAWLAGRAISRRRRERALDAA